MRESMLGKIVSLVVIASDEILRTLVDLLGKLLYGEGKGEFFTQFKKFLRKEECWVPEEVKGLIQKLGGMEGVRRFLSSNIFNLVVNYALSFDDMVGAGAYDWVARSMTEENFPKTGTGEVLVSAELIHFNKHISSEGAVIEMDKLGYRPATIYELLAFGAKYPDVQREFWIVALGSSCGVAGERHVAKLTFNGSMRCLSLGWRSVVWDNYYRFLGVRK